MVVVIIFHCVRLVLKFDMLLLECVNKKVYLNMYMLNRRDVGLQVFVETQV